MKLDEIFIAEYGLWTSQLSDLVHGAIVYHQRHPDSEEGRLLRHYIAPMLSYAHDHPDEIKFPNDFKLAIDMIRSNILNPVPSDLKHAVELLQRALPDYHNEEDTL